MNHTESGLEALRTFLENMVGEADLARAAGVAVTPAAVVDASFAQLLTLAREDLPLAHLLDTSDLVFHVEGPGAGHDAPWLAAVRWLTTTLDQTLRHLSGEVLELLGGDGRRLRNKLDLRLTGIAPGSLWVGTRIAAPPADLLPVDRGSLDRLIATMTALPRLVAFIGDDQLLPDIAEAFPDPALRDASLLALLKLAPSGRAGIHTLSFSAADRAPAHLSQRERVVLSNALKTMHGFAHHGTFSGEVRVADLDRTRFNLRTAHGVIRCLLADLPEAQARHILGRQAPHLQ